jgi:glycosyltransferase involved in cell wall biosynthesis
MIEPFTVTVVMPALNEADNLAGAVDNVLDCFCRFSISGELVIVNDGSHDGTGVLADGYASSNTNIRVLHHTAPQGIGRAFWAGVSAASGEIVTMIPGDGENDAAEILRYLPVMNEVDIVVPFVFNRSLRSFRRRLLSIIYREIIKTAFGLSLNYMNGTVMYRKSVLKGMTLKSNGFFYQSEILIKAISTGYLYAEVPCALRQRGSGDSRATTWKSFREVARHFISTFMAVRCGSGMGSVSEETATAKRKLELSAWNG